MRTPSIMGLFSKLGIKSLNVMKPPSIMGSFGTLSINDNQHNDIQQNDTQY